MIELKLATNTDRKSVFTQVLGYASYLFRLSPAAFEDLIRPHLATRGHATVVDAVAADIGDDSVDIDDFRNAMSQALELGLVRCVVVLDTATADLVELAGYLQTVTNDRLDIDLVTVTAYTIEGSRVLVPQLVEPQRVLVTSAQQPRQGRDARPTPGADAFADSIKTADSRHHELLRRLCDWARRLEADGLAALFTTVGKGRWVLNPRLPSQNRGMFTIWNDNGAYVSPQRSVLQSEAPKTLARLDERLPGEIGQNNYLTSDIDEEVLALLTDAYVEAANSAGISQRD